MADNKAIIYARVSTNKQADDGLPVESQIEHGHRKAEAMNADVLRVFTDAGISGRTDERPAFRDAVRYCKAYGVQFFICWSTSRFARNKLDAALYKRDLEASGTRVIYVSVDLDNRTDAGWMLEGMLEIFDEHYSRQVSADTSRSMVKNAQDGHFNGGRVPLGYETVPSGKRKKLAINESEVGTVREIFRMCIEGAGAKTIAMQLNKDERLNRGRRWNKNTVLNLLKNRIYIGQTVFNKTNHKTKTVKPMEEWIITQAHEPIIDQETFMEIQNRFGVRTPEEGGGSPNSCFVFTGLLKCGKCGAAMQITSSKGRSRRYHYYNCGTAHRVGGCENRRIAAYDFDEWMTDVVLEKILTRKMLVSMIEDLQELTSKWIKERAERRSATVKELRDVEKRQKNLYSVLELHGQDAPNLGDLTVRMRELKTQRDAIETRLIRIEEEEMPETVVSDIDVTEMAEMLRDIVKTTEDPKRLRMFFSSFIEGIVVDASCLVVNYDKSKLINQAGFDVVPTKPKWLPDLALLGTTFLEIRLPDRFMKKAA
ncbi:MAG: recombinase family protein [Gallionella sp.]|jgi:DNA invertase Pin-like site-specific DNA recombinase